MAPAPGPDSPPFWRIERLAETDSTNDLLLERARGGEAEGLVVWAEAQRRGRGRGGRAWHSPAGGGLYFSALLRPPSHPAQIPVMSLMSGVAAAEALGAASGLRVGLKWPNDLRVSGKKAGGILCEYEPRGGSPPAVVVGVGVNLTLRPEDFPPELRGRATSLRAAGGAVPEGEELLDLLLRRLEIWYKEFMINGFGQVRRRWTELCDNLGEEVAVSAGSEILQGTVRGIDEAGRLVLDLPEGGMARVEAGEVTEA